MYYPAFPALDHPDALRAKGVVIPDRMVPLVTELSQKDYARGLMIHFMHKHTGESQMILELPERIQIDAEFFNDVVVLETTDDTETLLLFYSTLFNEVTALRRCDYGDVVQWIELYVYKLLAVSAGAYQQYIVDGVMKSQCGNVLPVKGGVFTWEGSEAFKRK